MAYITTDEVAAMRKAIKLAFPECRFSITRENHSAISVSLMESPYGYADLFELETRKKNLVRAEQGFCDFNYDIAAKKADERIEEDMCDVEKGEFHLKLNEYYLESYTGKARDIFEVVKAIVDKGNHDNSDIQTDYFDVGWYKNFSIGKWDKGYKVATK